MSNFTSKNSFNRTQPRFFLSMYIIPTFAFSFKIYSQLKLESRTTNPVGRTYTSIYLNHMWDDDGHSLRGCGCVWVPVRESLCLFGRETQTKGLLARSPTRQEGRGKEGPRDDLAVEESREDIQQEGAEGTSRENSSVREMRVGQRGDQSIEVRKADAWTCWPTDAWWTNARS